jgi:hypothetical protein
MLVLVCRDNPKVYLSSIALRTVKMNPNNQ